MPINELIKQLEKIKEKYGEDLLFACFTKIDIAKDYDIVDRIE